MLLLAPKDGHLADPNAELAQAQEADLHIATEVEVLRRLV